MKYRRLTACAALAYALTLAPVTQSAVLQGDPSNYTQRIQLQPGDTLQLAAGTYERLSLRDLNGNDDAWITIEGPATGEARITHNSCCNTVQLRRCSYVTIRGFTIDSGGVAGLDGINAKDGASHHIRIEDNRIDPAAASRPWGSPRRVPPGTGHETLLSNRARVCTSVTAQALPPSSPSSRTWCCIQPATPCRSNIRTPLADAPSGPSSTFIRHNVFLKDDRASPSGNRPNCWSVLFPQADRDPRTSTKFMAIFCTTTRANRSRSFRVVAFHHNILVGAGPGQRAVLLTDHNGPLDTAYVYNNTIYGAGSGIRFGSAPRTAHAVIGNAVFSSQGLSGNYTNADANELHAVSSAPASLAARAKLWGSATSIPSMTRCVGSPLVYPSATTGHTDRPWTLTAPAVTAPIEAPTVDKAPTRAGNWTQHLKTSAPSRARVRRSCGKAPPRRTA